jgi:hypothetical protein
VNVWYGLLKDRIIGAFFIAEATITIDVYLDMLEWFVYSQAADLQLNIIYQQGGTPPWTLLF